jgi:hypothetical protein
MAQSNPAPALNKSVKELHARLVDVLGGPPRGGEPGDPYWDASSKQFQDDFKGRVAKLLKSYADQPAGAPGGDGQSTAKRTSG